MRHGKAKGPATANEVARAPRCDQLGQRICAEAKPPDYERPEDFLVTHKGELAGWVRCVGDIFIAYTDGGAYLGRFTNEIAAVLAITRRKAVR
jgi:hypothetical protein